MEYDYLLACGDSFTEGCQDIIGKGPEGTWPGIVAEHFKIPFSNIAKGGASNTEISLQPLQSNIPGFAKAKRPLIIFGLTVPYRLPYLSKMEGIIQSHYSILPEHMNDGDVKHLKNYALRLLGDSVDGMDGYVFATRQSIKIMMQYKIINPNAEVMWGWIHNLQTNSIDHKLYGGLNRDNCFNKHLNWLPLQYFTDADSEKYCLSEDDCHPNEQGIQLYADLLIQLIENNNEF